MRKIIQSLPQILIWSIVVLLLTSCAATQDVNVKAWIDAPRSGDSFEINTPIQILSHAYAKDTVAEMILYINGEAYRRDAAPVPGEDLLAFTQEWIPSEPGRYIVQVIAIDMNGEESLPARIGLIVNEIDTPTPTPLPTDTPTPTETPTETPTITFTPTVTPTQYIPPTSTNTIHPTITAKPVEVDEQAPSAPSLSAPANGSVVNCAATQTLVWQSVSDSSGISGYYVKLERLVSGSQWESVGGYGPVSNTQVAVPINCGLTYRWMVRAQDGAGNFSSWSSPSQFAVNLN